MMCLLQRPFITSLCDYDLCLYILKNTEISIAATVISHLGKHDFLKVTEPKGNISAWNVSALAPLQMPSQAIAAPCSFAYSYPIV